MENEKIISKMMQYSDDFCKSLNKDDLRLEYINNSNSVDIISGDELYQLSLERIK